MTTMETDRLVDDYLQRLEAAAAHLQRSRRAELVAEIREHIEAALQEQEAAGEAAVRNILERLGRPEEIVAAAEPPPAAATSRAGRLELAALIALVVPFIGWLVGIVLVVASQAWSRRDKAIGVGLVLTLVLLPLLATVATGAESGTREPVPVGGEGPAGLQENTDGSAFGGLELAVLGLALFAGLPSALYLGWRLRRVEGS
jgi:predicted DNA-binding protein